MEDKIKAVLENAGLKMESLRKSFDQANAQASSILLFTLKWRDLEDHLEKTRTLVEKQAKEVSLREMQLGETTESLEQCLKEVEGQVEDKLRELGEEEKRLKGIHKAIEDWSEELKGIESGLKEKSSEFALKEMKLTEYLLEFDLEEGMFKEKERELGLREKL